MSEWIYLSDEIILGELTNDIGRNALTNFYNQCLTKNYKKVIDYKRINKNDELVTRFLSKTNKNKVKQTTKLYYAVTKEAYGKILNEGKIRKAKVILHPEQIISNKLSPFYLFMLNTKKSKLGYYLGHFDIKWLFLV